MDYARAKFGDFSLSSFGFIEQTDRQTDRHYCTQTDIQYHTQTESQTLLNAFLALLSSFDDLPIILKSVLLKT